jgi:mannose-P-dolichol utilization defect protein 1
MKEKKVIYVLEMEKQFENLMSYFMTPKCYEEIFYKFNLTNVDCLKMIISKGLGYGILAGALLLRVPQIIKILGAKSGDGISVISELLSMIAIFGTMSYGYFKQFPIAAYGDAYLLFLQSIMVLTLVLYFQKKHCSTVIVLVLSGVASALLYLNLINETIIVGLNGMKKKTILNKNTKKKIFKNLFY